MNRLRTQRQPHETDSASRFFTKNQKKTTTKTLSRTRTHADSTGTPVRFKQLTASSSSEPSPLTSAY